MIIILAYSVEKNRLLARSYGNPIKGHPIKQVQLSQSGMVEGMIRQAQE